MGADEARPRAPSVTGVKGTTSLRVPRDFVPLYEVGSREERPGRMESVEIWENGEGRGEGGWGGVGG